jgi:hypothetical protein
MRLFNLGKKDEYGRQVRIEHRGRYLRISRTGGVALRAQAKLRGVNLTANTRHGVRVSATPVKNTQIALQNGRFVLRGRYGRGPTKLNVSKSGASVSTRNAMGTMNWTHPKRSSARFAGVQFRGSTALTMQVAYFLVTGLVLAVKGVLQLGGLAFSALAAMPQLLGGGLQGPARMQRNRGLEASFVEQDRRLSPPISGWTTPELLAGLQVVLTGWGRGQTALAAAVQALARAGTPAEPLFTPAAPDLLEVASRLDAARESDSEGTHTDPRALLAHIVQTLADRLSADALPELLLEADEQLLRAGPRTVLQEELLEVFADFAGITAEPHPGR